MEFRQTLAHIPTRPLLWGFFVFSFLTVALVGVRWFWQSSAQKNWPELQAGREQQIHQIVSSAFYAHVRELLDIAQKVKGDRTLFDDLSSQEPTSILRAFERLAAHRTGDRITIDIVDQRGNVVLWAGQSARVTFTNSQYTTSDTALALSKSRLHTFLALRLPVPEQFLSVVVSKALEVNYPISNRFVSLTSFAAALSDRLGAEVKLLVASPDTTRDDGFFYVPLKDSHRNVIGYVAVGRPTVESELQRINAQIDWMVSSSAGVAVLLAAFAAIVSLAHVSSAIVRSLLLTLVLWATRYVWLALGFPRQLIGTSLFEPVLYSTPFGGGITESLGETLITVSILLLNVLWILAEAKGRLQEHEDPLPVNSRPWLLLVVVVLIVGFLYLTHGFGEALRSFVFDSTLQYHDPTALLPGGPLAVMHLTILLLTLAYLALSTGLMFLMVRLTRFSFPRAVVRYHDVLVVVILFGLVWGAMFFLPIAPKFPTYYPLFIVLLTGTLLFVLRRFGRSTTIPGGYARNAVWVITAAFVAAVPLLDHKLHQKDREHLQLVAEELLRPVDSWLSLVINEGLRTTADAQEVWRQTNERQRESPSDIAFSLWSQTLVGREGYNSALMLYDASGREFSRFGVGLTSFEQTEMLRAMFNAEEEVLQVVERKLPTGALTYYGAWTTVRDSSNQPVGFVALMLAANQRSLFRGEAPEPLRPLTRERFERHFRDVIISEFQNGTLTMTNSAQFYRGMPLPEDVMAWFQDARSKFLWRTQFHDGREYETLYARDETRPGVVHALALETLDIRWHLFNGVKVAFVYLAVVVVVLLLQSSVRGMRKELQAFGFRARLLIAFGVLTILPLFLLAYYNRELATERLESSVSRRLVEDLSLLERRMLQTFDDEEDFLNGMTDDYCETVASELGVDFTVYRSAAMKASSRPELYQTAILDSRLPGQAYANTVLVGRSYFQDVEQIGEVPYTVGYKPLMLGDRIVGVLAVQALYRQREIDEELAQRNVYTMGVYALVLVVLIILGFVLAHRLSRPLRELTMASREVARGNLEVQVTPMTTDEIGELMKSFNDMVRELRVSREQIVRAERESAWKEMAKQVAHEIKNPLTPMKLSVQHLRRAYHDKAPEFPALLERITQTVIEQIETLSRIASEFSNFARMPERSYERVDVHLLLRETINLFREIGGIEFRTKFSDTTPVIVADRSELQRVFINLIRNSVQAMEKGGTITIETSVQDHRCVIAFTDTGPGIPPSIQQKVFEPNFSTKTDGTGLGLAISRRIIEDLNGTIQLTSAVGKGTTFTIILPTQSTPHA
jgi:signal transduction histidine kinase